MKYFCSLYTSCMKRTLYLSALLLLILAACNNNNQATSTTKDVAVATNSLSYTLVRTHPHDPSMFTEGLEFYKGHLYESSGPGSAGEDGEGPWPSGFGIVDSASGKVTMKVSLDKKKYFGEGITFFNGKVYQLTWQSKTGFVYDASTFKKIKEFTIPAKEGWGLTHDSTHLIMSDGSSTLYFLNPETLDIDREITVSDNGTAIPNINELEYINGYIYCNQWEAPYIFKIDPATGAIKGRLDLSDLVRETQARSQQAEVLNGIAYSPAGTLYVTGKNWPNIYEIRLK